MKQSSSHAFHLAANFSLAFCSSLKSVRRASETSSINKKMESSSWKTLDWSPSHFKNLKWSQKQGHYACNSDLGGWILSFHSHPTLFMPFLRHYLRQARSKGPWLNRKNLVTFLDFPEIRRYHPIWTLPSPGRSGQNSPSSNPKNVIFHPKWQNFVVTDVLMYSVSLSKKWMVTSFCCTFRVNQNIIFASNQQRNWHDLLCRHRCWWFKAAEFTAWCGGTSGDADT